MNYIEMINKIMQKGISNISSTLSYIIVMLKKGAFYGFRIRT